MKAIEIKLSTDGLLLCEGMDEKTCAVELRLPNGGVAGGLRAEKRALDAFCRAAAAPPDRARSLPLYGRLGERRGKLTLANGRCRVTLGAEALPPLSVEETAALAHDVSAQCAALDWGGGGCDYFLADLPEREAAWQAQSELVAALCTLRGRRLSRLLLSAEAALEAEPLGGGRFLFEISRWLFVGERSAAELLCDGGGHALCRAAAELPPLEARRGLLPLFSERPAFVDGARVLGAELAGCALESAACADGAITLDFDRARLAIFLDGGAAVSAR